MCCFFKFPNYVALTTYQDMFFFSESSSGEKATSMAHTFLPNLETPPAPSTPHLNMPRKHQLRPPRRSHAPEQLHNQPYTCQAAQSYLHIARTRQRLQRHGSMGNSGHNCPSDQQGSMCDGTYGEQTDDTSDSATHSSSDHNHGNPTVMARVCQ